MTLEELKKAVCEIKKGTFIHIEYESVKLIQGKELKKESYGEYRIGLNYANLGSQKNKVTGELPWGQWVKGFETYIIEHIPKGAEAPKYYFRIYTTNTIKSKVKYFLNGIERSKQWLTDNGFIKDKASKPLDCFVVPIENVKILGNK